MRKIVEARHVVRDLTDTVQVMAAVPQETVDVMNQLLRAADGSIRVLARDEAEVSWMKNGHMLYFHVTWATDLKVGDHIKFTRSEYDEAAQELRFIIDGGRIESFSSKGGDQMFVVKSDHDGGIVFISPGEIVSAFGEQLQRG